MTATLLDASASVSPLIDPLRGGPAVPRSEDMGDLAVLTNNGRDVDSGRGTDVEQRHVVGAGRLHYVSRYGTSSSDRRLGQERATMTSSARLVIKELVVE